MNNDNSRDEDVIEWEEDNLSDDPLWEDFEIPEDASDSGEVSFSEPITVDEGRVAQKARDAVFQNQDLENRAVTTPEITVPPEIEKLVKEFEKGGEKEIVKKLATDTSAEITSAPQNTPTHEQGQGNANISPANRNQAQAKQTTPLIYTQAPASEEKAPSFNEKTPEKEEAPSENVPGINKIPIRSYYQDMESVMQKAQTGTMAQALEEDRQEKAIKKSRSPFSSKNLAFLILSLLFIVASIGMLGYIFITRIAPFQVAPEQRITVPSIAPADEHIAIATEGASPSKTEALLGDAFATNTVDGTFYHFYLTDVSGGQTVRLGTQSMMAKLGIALPAVLQQALTSNVMLGALVLEKETQPFLIFEVTSFDRAFMGMQEWESSMLDDIKSLFAISTARLRPETFQQPFIDKVLENKTARVLFEADESSLQISASPNATILETQMENTADSLSETDSLNTRFTPIDENDILILYTFINERTLIITTHPDVLNEIKKRLANKQIYQ